MGVSALICAALLCGEVVSADRNYEDCMIRVIESLFVGALVIGIVAAVVISCIIMNVIIDRSCQDCLTLYTAGIVVGALIIGIVVAVVIFFSKRKGIIDRSSEDCSTWNIAGIVGGALVIGFVVAVFLFFSKRKGIIDKNSEGCLTWTTAALVVGALVMTAALIVFSKRKGIIVISSPINLRVVEISATSVKVQWEKGLGEIDRYIVLVSPSQTNGSGLSREIMVPSGEDAAEIVHLDPGRLYIITLVAEKDGARSKPTTVQTTPGSKVDCSDSISDSENSTSTENITASTEASHSGFRSCDNTTVMMHRTSSDLGRKAHVPPAEDQRTLL